MNKMKNNELQIKESCSAKSPSKFDIPCSIFDIQVLDQMIDAPAGIKRLRELILQLAVQGKLVEQRPEEGTAEELLKQIKEAKRKDLQERKARGERIRKQKPLPPIEKNEIPFDIPKNWKWVRLGELSYFENGDRSTRYPNATDLKITGIPFFGAKDMVNGALSFDNGLRFISSEKFEELSNGKLLNNDFVILLRGTVGKIARFSKTTAFQTGFINAQMLIIRLIKQDMCSFFSLYSTSIFFQSMIVGKTTGSAIRQMPARVLPLFTFPLPPLAEQKRIVAKVDELMGWCNSLDELKQKRDTLQAAALKSSLFELTSSAPQRLGIKEIFPLIQKPEHIKPLRDAILQLAVQGRLVPQCPEDGTADELLKQIEEAKQKDLEQRKARGERIRKTKPLLPIEEDEIPFNIPKGWKWVKTGETGLIFNGNSINKNKKIELSKSGEGLPFIATKDLGYGRTKLAYENGVTIPLNEPKFKIAHSQSVLICSEGGSAGKKIGLTERDIYFGNKLYANKTWKGIEPRFVFSTYLTPYFYEQFSERMTGIIGGISRGQFIEIPFPLPPLAEQKRIVAKVDELMNWCDELETYLKTQKETSTRFASAIAQRGNTK